MEYYICNYYNNNFRSIDEYDFLLILSHTYQCFRSIRSTEAEEEIPLDTPLIKTFCNTEKRAAGFFFALRRLGHHPPTHARQCLHSSRARRAQVCAREAARGRGSTSGYA